MSFEQDKERKKLQLFDLKIKANKTEKEQDKLTKLATQLKELRNKIGKKKLEIEKETGWREKINANTRFFKQQMDQTLEELNQAKPDPTFIHPLNYLLLKSDKIKCYTIIWL